jgi:type II secretory pathway pseudopilin PulG
VRRNYITQRGETIVEVLIAIAVMSAALGGAFAISTRSQRTVQSNQERYQATLIANQQADLIKLAQAYEGKVTKINSFGNSDGSKVFCMSDTGDVGNLTDTGTTSPPLDAECLVPFGNPAAFDYRVRVQPIQSDIGVGKPVDTFIITVDWDSISSKSGTDTVRLIYGI